MALLDSCPDRIDGSNDLLSLGTSKTVSFCGDGDGGGPLLWKSAQLPLDKSDGSDSSAVISPTHKVAEGKMSPDSSQQSGSTLKEHDYMMGMAEVCSASLEQEKSQCGSEKLSLKETDLCLGLGLALRPSSNIEAAEDAQKTVDFAFYLPKGVLKTVGDASMSTRQAFLEGASVDLRSLQCAWPNVSLTTASADSMNGAKLSSHNQNIDYQSSQMIAPVLQEVLGASRVGFCFQGGRVAMDPSTFKNGLKRGYSEAMSDMASLNMTPEVKAMSAMAVKNGDMEAKALSKQPQNSFSGSWACSRPSVTLPWQSTLIPFGVSKGVTINRLEKSAADASQPAFSGKCGPDNVTQNSSANETPAPKDRVVGWPPIRSYRKATLSKPTEMFVKVNTDGVTVGRKVDLNAHSSYESLLSALEEMFQPSNNAQGGSLVASGSCANDSKHFRLFSGSELVLTYEDKDGDWMLVGDVPWSMFATTVRRLRITRGLEAIGPGRRGSEKVK